jgi:3-hydroxyacyl-[acyl-carrier-protein] dehydratase
MIASSEYNIGAEIIEDMINVQHPLIMVDKITAYNSQIGFLRSKKYISANEPVFTGHFPGFKLWPGILTIEGLRQSALLYLAMQKIETKDLLAGIVQLQLQMTLVPHADKTLSENTLNYLKQMRSTVQNTFDMRIKLVAPVFSACVIDYEINQDQENKDSFFAKAIVNQRIVAEGKIKLINENS